MKRRAANLPSDQDPIVRTASEVIGGSLGRYAGIDTQLWGASSAEPRKGGVGAEPRAGSPAGEAAPIRVSWLELALRRALRDVVEVGTGSDGLRPRRSPLEESGLRPATSIQRARVGISVLPWQPVVAVLSVLASIALSFGVIQKSFCFTRGWTVPDAFWRACYADMPFLFQNSPLSHGAIPYPPEGQEALAQPLGTGLVLWLASLVVPSGASPVERQQWYMGVWAVLIAVLLMVLITVTARTRRRDPWCAAHIALSPLIVTVGLVSPDLVGVVLASWGMYIWARERPTVAGIVLGLGAATRTYPILIAIVLVPLGIRAGRHRAAVRAVVAAFAVWAFLIAVSLTPSGGTVLTPYRAWAGAGADYGSIWYLTRLFDRDIGSGVMTAIVVLGWILALVAGAALALMPAHRPMVVEVVLVVVALTLVTGKSVPVQSSLWLLPLIAMAGLRWRDHLIWAGTEVVYFMAVWLHLGGAYDVNRALPLSWYAFFTVLRLAGIMYLVWRVFRRVRSRPAPGPSISSRAEIRADPDDGAGPFTGAHDAVVVAIQ